MVEKRDNKQRIIYIAVALGVVGALIAVGVFARGRAQVSSVTSVIEAEAQAVKDFDLAKIMAVYDASATVLEVDELGAPRQWSGSAQIYRKYRQMLRTQKFSRLEHIPRDVRIRGDMAIVVTDVDGQYTRWQGPTVEIHSERTEIWTLARRGGQWRILRYVYGQKVPPVN